MVTNMLLSSVRPESAAMQFQVPRMWLYFYFIKNFPRPHGERANEPFSGLFRALGFVYPW